MEDANFYNRINELIAEIRKADQVDVNLKRSYSHLISLLSNLSLANIRDEKDAIMYFIIDSYDGDTQVANKIVEFLQLYASKKKK
jgi:hypothetical protein